MQKQPKLAPKQQRQFLGKTDSFKNKEERVFNQRMLKAYLKGNTHFNFGYNPKSSNYLIPANKRRKTHLVLQKY